MNTSTSLYRSISKYTAEIAKQMTAQIKINAVNLFDKISITNILKSFKFAYVTKEIHEGAAICVIHFLIGKTAPTLLSARLSFERTDRQHSWSAGSTARCYITYPQTDRFLREKTAIDHKTSETESETPHFVQPTEMDIFYCAEKLVKKSFHCGFVCTRYALN